MHVNDSRWQATPLPLGEAYHGQLDRPGDVDRARVEQQLLGDGGLAGVRVADDRERPP